MGVWPERCFTSGTSWLPVTDTFDPARPQYSFREICEMLGAREIPITNILGGRIDHPHQRYKSDLVHFWRSVIWSLCIVIGNWFVLSGREDLEAFGHKRCQFVTIGCNVVEDLLNRSPKFRKGLIVA